MSRPLALKRPVDDPLRPLLPLSPSRMADFDGGARGAYGCGLRGKLKHLDKISEPQGPEAKVGQLVHEVMAAYAAHCLESQRELDVDWLAARAAQLPRDDRGDEVRGMLVRVAEAVTFPVIADARHALEFRLSLDSRGEPTPWEDAWWRGILDYARFLPTQRHLVVRDWKSDRILPPVSAAPDPAILDYAYAAARHLWPTDGTPEEVTVELHYLRYGAVRSWTLPWSEIADRPAQIRQRAEAILREGFRPRVGWHCGWCVFQGQCGGYKKLYGDARTTEYRPPSSPEEAQGLAAQLFVLKDRVKKLDDAARAWCDEHGDVTIDDGLVLGYDGRNKSSVTNAQAVLHALRDEHGIAPATIWAALHVGKDAVEKLLRGAGVRGKALAAWWEVADARGWLGKTTESVFGFRKGAMP